MRNAKVECPDCGLMFSTRGIAGHRRLKHDVVAVQSSSSASLARSERNGRLASTEVSATLTTLCSWLQRVESRLANMEALALAPALVGASGEHGGPQDDEIVELRKELGSVLEDIAEAKQEAEVAEDDTDAQKRLGELRLRQAQILMRMGPDAPGARGHGLLAML
ncbi:MAG: hypothetical protein GY711_14115 [bacterium]|nr:hypothetical protein [bacterium]